MFRRTDLSRATGAAHNDRYGMNTTIDNTSMEPSVDVGRVTKMLRDMTDYERVLIDLGYENLGELKAETGRTDLQYDDDYDR